MILPTPKGEVYLADSIRDLSARRHLLFQQAWAREIGLGSDMYAVDSHFARLGMLLRGQDMGAALTEYNNAVLALTNLTTEVPTDFRCQMLACLATRHSEDVSEDGLQATGGYLASVLTQAQVTAAVEESKKNFAPSWPLPTLTDSTPRAATPTPKRSAMHSFWNAMRSWRTTPRHLWDRWRS